MRAAGSGTYAVANIASGTGAGDQFGGWTLVIAIKDPAKPTRNLTVYDGLARVGTGDPASVTVNGFLAPPSGAVNANVGVLSFEGDAPTAGDTGTLVSGPRSTPLTDAANPAGNYANSSFSRGGTRLTGNRNPEYFNQLGYDADVFTTTNSIPNSGTSATLNFDSGGDVYYPSLAAFAIDVDYPNLAAGATKDVVDLNGGRPEPGDQLEYTIQFNNTGEDPAVETVVTDAIPALSSHVPGSLSVSAGANTGAKSDAAGDDQGEFDAASNRVVVRAGAGATAGSGGTLDPGEQTSVTFRVTISPAARNGDDVIALEQTPAGVVKTTKQVTVSFTATNNGPSTAIKRGRPDRHPGGPRRRLRPVWCTVDPADGRVYACDLDDVARGASRTGGFVLRAEVLDDAARLTVSASAGSDRNDPSVAADTLDVSVIPAAALSVTAAFVGQTPARAERHLPDPDHQRRPVDRAWGRCHRRAPRGLRDRLRGPGERQLRSVRLVAALRGRRHRGRQHACGDGHRPCTGQRRGRLVRSHPPAHLPDRRAR